MINPLLRFGSFVVIVAALLGLGFVGKLAYEKVMMRSQAAGIVAAEEVAFYSELNLTDEGAVKWNNLFAKYPDWQINKLQEKLLNFWGVENGFEMGTKMALVLTPDWEPVIFWIDFPGAVLDELENKWGASWVDDIVVAGERAVAWTKRGDFTVMARNAAVLDKVLNNEGVRLNTGEDFVRIRDGLPEGVGLVYFDGSKLANNRAAVDIGHELWQPVAGLVQAGGATLSLSDAGLLIRTKTIYGDSARDVISKIFSRVKSVRRELSEFFPANVIAFYESSDLRTDFLDLENVLRNGAPVLYELISGQKIYWEEGTGLSLTEDVLKLADGPYALGVTYELDATGSGGHLAMAGVFKNDGDFLQEKMAYFEDVVMNRIPAMYPETTHVQLSDGTTTPVLRVGKAPEKEAFEMGGVAAVSIVFPDASFDLAYAIDDDKLILATSKKLLIDMIVAQSQEGELLSDRKDFKEGLSVMDGMKTDMLFADLSKVSEWLPLSWRSWLEPFSALTGGKNLLDFESLAAWWLKIQN